MQEPMDFLQPPPPPASVADVPPALAAAPAEDWTGSAGVAPPTPVVPQGPPDAMGPPAPTLNQPGETHMVQEPVNSQQLVNDNNKLMRDADKVAKEQTKAVNENKQKAVNAENALVKAQMEQNDAQAPILQHTAKEEQALYRAQKDVKDEYEKQIADFKVSSEALLQQTEAHLAASHPKDIWEASGTNPILGSFAVALSGINSAVNGGPNQAFELIKGRAQLRANQLATEGEALGLKSSILARTVNDASKIYGDKMDGVKFMHAQLLNTSATQLAEAANFYANPQARAKADATVAKLQMEAQKSIAEITDNTLKRKREAIAMNTNIFQLGQHHLDAVHAEANRHEEAQTRIYATGHKEDPMAARARIRGEQNTEHVIQLLSEYKHTDDAAKKRQLREQIAPLLGIADQPLSNRLMTHDAKEGELGKLGSVSAENIGTGIGAALGGIGGGVLGSVVPGVGTAFGATGGAAAGSALGRALGSYFRFGDEDVDGLIKMLRDQQAQREKGFVPAAASSGGGDE